MSYIKQAVSHTCAKSKVQYSDVVIIGNGPSGICLSYLLSGNLPYSNGIPHSNTYLTQKLQQLKDGGVTSIIDQDLEHLSEGLEGRSSNPVALLFDALQHPDADFGADLPPLLHWKKDSQRSIDHVVLGKLKPGGAWQAMDGSMQTLSLSRWMELPSTTFRDWLGQEGRHDGTPEPCSIRANLSEVRDYYTDYVRQHNLESNFYNYHTVTSVRKVFQMRNMVDSESGEVEPCCKNVAQNHSFIWEVRGYKIRSNSSSLCEEVFKEEFCFHTPHVVLATGSYDIPNRLGISGEKLPYVFHSLPEFEKAINFEELCNKIDPVLVVGAGLSAADAILMAVNAGIPVLHVFRRSANDSNLIFKKLPSAMYPEYHMVHSMMKGTMSNPLYRAYAKHQLVEFKEDQKVLLQAIGSSDVIMSVDVTCAVVLVGASSDLSFLPQEGRNLGVLKKCQINSKSNPVAVDPFTFESLHEQSLFAVGPLVGDNFVRFAVGGAFGVASQLLKKSHARDHC